MSRRAAKETPEEIAERVALEERERVDHRARIRELGMAGLVLVIVLGALVVTHSVMAPEPTTMAVRSALSLSCSSSDDGVLTAATTTGDIRVGSSPNEHEYASPLTQPQQAGQWQIVPVDDQASIAGGVLGGSGADSWYSPCAEPRTDQVVQLSGGNVQLTLSNPDSTEAIVSLTLSGPQGQISADQLRDVHIDANSVETLDLSGYLGDASPVGVRIRATQGRVAATGRTSSETGVEYQRATTLGSTMSVAGIPASAPSMRLLLTNPDTVLRAVTLTVVGESGEFTPTENARVNIPAGSTIAVEVPSQASSEYTAILVDVTSGTENSAGIAVSASFGTAQDIALISGDGATGNSTQALVPIPEQGKLVVTNLADTPADLDLGWSSGATDQRSIPARTTITVDTPADAGAVTLHSSQQISAGLVAGDSGMMVVPAEMMTAGSSDLRVQQAADLGHHTGG